MASQESAYDDGDQTPNTQARGLPEEEEDEEEEELQEEEGARGRFKSERNSCLPLKSNRQSYGDIPDSLGKSLIHDSNKYCK